MKSYKQAIQTINYGLELLNHQKKIIKKFPPGLYKLDDYHEKGLLIITRHYYCYQEATRNRINVSVIASEDRFDTLPFRVSLLLGSMPDCYSLTPIAVKDLPLFIRWESKSPVFEKILRDGKLPKNQRTF